ncbi:MAG TPA: hypothetical protein VNE39_12650 [Planctomycetota bacterium]|nr:hypothetical protein [Planctomycetota bacterium]
MPHDRIDLSKVKTYHLGERRNLVKLADLVRPCQPPPPFEHPELYLVARAIREARRAGRPVLWMLGAHVVKSGLSLLIIDLMQRGLVTHVAGNGAVSIHDFELALIGETSEDVPDSIEDGSFGMADETGRLINEAVQAGVRDGLGYGEALGRLYAADPRFKHRDASILYQGHKLGIPVTIHVTIGTDIIHQHPAVDFGALGAASGLDFRTYCATVANLEGGVFCNFGSAVTGPEVFLKALSIARNLGHTVSHITTANFDLFPLRGDYRADVSKDGIEYYYRPRKNIVNRPVSLGGRGYHITGDHKATIPNLYQMLTE